MACGNHQFIDARLGYVAKAPARLGRAAFWQRCRATLRVWRERAWERRALSRLDDRLLADIGVTRAEAERESAVPFWRSGADDGQGPLYSI